MKNEIGNVFQEIRNLVLKEDESIINNNANLEWILQSIENILIYNESPIEKKFLLSLIAEIINEYKGKDLWENPISIWTNNIEDLFPDDLVGREKIITIFINPTIGNYRPDVVLSNNVKNIIFEMDGFEYHNTKEQLIRDKKRERDLSKLGYKIYRFSGSEIYKNSKKVAKEALSIIYKEFNL